MRADMGKQMATRPLQRDRVVRPRLDPTRRTPVIVTLAVFLILASPIAGHASPATPTSPLAGALRPATQSTSDGRLSLAARSLRIGRSRGGWFLGRRDTSCLSSWGRRPSETSSECIERKWRTTVLVAKVLGVFLALALGALLLMHRGIIPDLPRRRSRGAYRPNLRRDEHLDTPSYVRDAAAGDDSGSPVGTPADTASGEATGSPVIPAGAGPFPYAGGGSPPIATTAAATSSLGDPDAPASTSDTGSNATTAGPGAAHLGDLAATIAGGSVLQQPIVVPCAGRIVVDLAWRGAPLQVALGAEGGWALNVEVPLTPHRIELDVTAGTWWLHICDPRPMPGEVQHAQARVWHVPAAAPPMAA